MALVLGAVRLGLGVDAIEVRGDSTTANRGAVTALHGSFRRDLVINAATVFVIQGVTTGARVTAELHVPAEFNRVCDHLSRKGAMAEVRSRWP